MSTSYSCECCHRQFAVRNSIGNGKTILHLPTDPQHLDPTMILTSEYGYRTTLGSLIAYETDEVDVIAGIDHD